MPVLICAYCKKPFEVQPAFAKKAQFCSRDCKDKASRKRIQKRCLCCGETFLAVTKERLFCDRYCFYAYQLGMSRERYLKERTTSQVKLSVRKCHDCGKPTTDYRCSSCRDKWRKRHGVPEGAEKW